MSEEFKFDEIGYWSEIKLEIINDYAKEYMKILSKQNFLKPIYVDAFSGAGKHLSKVSKKEISGSPQNALAISPPFKEYHFIDMNAAKLDYLKESVEDRDSVFFYNGDCNQVLIEKIFPTITYKDYKRALCLLDPYGLQLDWKVIQQAGKSGVMEIFLNFPVLDMQRNVIWEKYKDVSRYNLNRMNVFWGDESWKNIAYEEEQTLFGDEKVKTKPDIIIKAFQERLKDVAGFKYVPEPMAMRNTKGNIVYYLYFASCNATANKIVEYIFTKNRDRRS